MAKAHAIFPFTFAIMMGDNMYGTERTADYVKKFEIPYKPLLDAKVDFYAAMTEVGFDTDRSYMLVEIAGDLLTFQTLSRTGKRVDGGTIRRTVPASSTTAATGPTKN